MIDLRNPKLEDFKHIEAPVRESATRKIFASFYRVKPGSYVVPRTEHKVTKLPEGILRVIGTGTLVHSLGSMDLSL